MIVELSATVGTQIQVTTIVHETGQIWKENARVAAGPLTESDAEGWGNTRVAGLYLAYWGWENAYSPTVHGLDVGTKSYAMFATLTEFDDAAALAAPFVDLNTGFDD